MNLDKEEDIRETQLVKKIEAYIERINDKREGLDSARSHNYPLDKQSTFVIWSYEAGFNQRRVLDTVKGRFLDVIAYAVILKDLTNGIEFNGKYNEFNGYIEKVEKKTEKQIIPDHDLDFLIKKG